MSDSKVAAETIEDTTIPFSATTRMARPVWKGVPFPTPEQDQEQEMEAERLRKLVENMDMFNFLPIVEIETRDVIGQGKRITPDAWKAEMRLRAYLAPGAPRTDLERLLNSDYFKLDKVRRDLIDVAEGLQQRTGGDFVYPPPGMGRWNKTPNTLRPIGR